MNTCAWSCTMFVFIVAHLVPFSSVSAESVLVDNPLPVSETNRANSIQNKWRIQDYSEIMTPAINGTNIPTPQGGTLAPTLVEGRVWLDYAFTEKYRLFFWQRYFYFPFNDFSLYDPRIGFRWMQVFDIPGLTTTYDFYFLPGISQMAQDDNRILELGIRTNTTYSIPSSRWDLGIVTEVNAPFYQSGLNGGDQTKKLWGVLAPWTSYKISKYFSTQHWFMFPFKFQQGSFSWDITGMPFVQNGIGWIASEAVWIGAFLNNYLFTAPTLQNTWMSIWLNLSII